METAVHLVDEAGYTFLDRYTVRTVDELPWEVRYEGDLYRLFLRTPGEVWYRVVRGVGDEDV